MRNGKRFHAVLLVLALLAAGCRDSEEVAARKKLSRQIDLARRCYEGATSLLADPAYIDSVTGRGLATAEVLVLENDTRIAGDVTQTGNVYRVKTRKGEVKEVPADQVKRIEWFETPPAEIEVATQPADTNEAVELLDKASGLVSDALASNPGARPGVKADAQQLLADIEFARGTLFVTTAGHLRVRATGLRGHDHALISATRNYVIAIQFNKSLSNMPREKITDLRAKAGKDLNAHNAGMKAIDGGIAALQKEMAGWIQKNAELTKKSRDLRVASDAQGGQKGLDLLKEAHKWERETGRNQVKVDASKEKIVSLLVDKRLLAVKVEAAKTKLDLLKKRLETMDEQKGEASKAMEAAKADAKRAFEEVTAVADRIVNIDTAAGGKEAAALKALARTVEHLDAAEKHLGAERVAAKAVQSKQTEGGSEIADDLADDKHLAAIIASKASAKLAMGELRSRQLGAAKSNKALAKAIADLAKELEEEAPPVVVHLEAQGVNEAEVRSLAAKNYQQAEEDLEGLLGSHLKRGMGKNIRWIYQGQLADTYLGHYRLTGDAAVLAKARKLVDEAVKGKERSPYLSSVLQLQQLIEAAGG